MSFPFRFNTFIRVFAAVALSLCFFASGYLAGQNRFGQPKTILHVVEIKWNPGVSAADKQRVLAGLKGLAGKIPGIRNVWLQADRLEPRDFNAAYAIEFQNRAAADAYAESRLHDAWDATYVPLRYASISIQLTNP
jgi:hypothetical protein